MRGPEQAQGSGGKGTPNPQLPERGRNRKCANEGPLHVGLTGTRGCLYCDREATEGEEVCWGQKSVSECRPDIYELRPVSKLLPKLHLAHR